MIKQKFFGIIKGGILIQRNPELFSKHLQNFEDGQEVEMTLEKKYKCRTQGAPGEETNFNGYYWAVVVRIISDVMGELDDTATHNLLQMIFNRRGVKVRDPETKEVINYEIPRGTKKMTGGEFSEYCAKIRAWASLPGNLTEHGVYIPDPHEAEYE